LIDLVKMSSTMKLELKTGLRMNIQ